MKTKINYFLFHDKNTAPHNKKLMTLILKSTLTKRKKPLNGAECITSDMKIINFAMKRFTFKEYENVKYKHFD